MFFSRRSQIGLFIVLGVFLVILLSLFLFLDKVDTQTDHAIENDIDPSNLILFVENCMKDVTSEGMRYIADQGGYYILPELRTDYVLLNTAYYYTGEMHIPSITDVQNGLSQYVNANLDTCLNYSSFEEMGYSISAGPYDVDVLINQKGIQTSLKSSISISNEEESDEISPLHVRTYSRIFDMLNAAEEFVLSYKEKEDAICLTCNLDMSDRHKVLLNFRERGDDLQVTVIDDFISDEEYGPRLKLRFAVGEAA